LRRRRRKRRRTGGGPAGNDQSLRNGAAGLTGSLLGDVEPEVRQRGEVYFRQGRVLVPKITPERFSAEVRGKGGNYVVTMDLAFDDKRGRTTVSAICSCPYFAEGRGACKHIWAALCFADGMPECEFKAPTGHPVGLRTRMGPITSRLPAPAVVSVDPNAAGRIRAFSAAGGIAGPARKPEPRNHRAANDQVSWREALKLVANAQREIGDAEQKRTAPTPATDVHYIIDTSATRKSGLLTLQIFRLTNVGEGGARHLFGAPVDPQAIEQISQGPDRDLLSWFFGVANTATVRNGSWAEGGLVLRMRANSFVIADALRAQVVEHMAATGRFGWLAVDEAKLEEGTPIDIDHFRPVTWDMGDPWIFRLAVIVRKRDHAWDVRGQFRRGGITVPQSDTVAAFADGLVIFKDRVVRADIPDVRVCGWLNTLYQIGSVKVDKADQAPFLRTLVGLPSAPPIDLPHGTGWTIVTGEPRARLIFQAMPTVDLPAVLMANYEFDYETPNFPPSNGLPNAGQRRAPHRGRSPVVPRPTEPIAEAKDPGGAEVADLVEAEESPESIESVESVDSAESANATDTDAAAENAEAAKSPPDNVRSIAADREARQPVVAEQRRFVVRRDRDRETAMVTDLCSHSGVHPSAGRSVAGADVFVDAATLTELITAIASRGWSIEAEGRRVRAGRSFNVDVKSGVDWLNLKASFDFGDGVAVELPKILEAVRRGDGRVQLGDGTVGLLPEAWLKKLDPILRMGEDGGEGDGLRYRASQAAFLDVLVSDAKEATLDASFTAFREKLAAFSGVNASEPDSAFVGELRPYQKQGLGWLEFLDEFNFGGCLADDMGLGKTVQVLAYLHKHRRAAKKRRKKLPPTLIVAPTSLIYNWADESKRFVPDLKVCAHLGAARHRTQEELLAYDLIITSYGTMRSDIEMLAGLAFDYVVLDEAQAIKNESTQSAKAARLLKAHRRLAMSGTPVENRLAELGSIFRFLNPGMLDSGAGFAELFTGSGKLTPGKLETLARVLRPFILRRTKDQVLPDLPGKTESTVYCVLEDEQRREYDELAAHFRDSLTKKVKSVGLGKSQMQVLEALLRLRQMACHPGLIDEKRVGEPSAKLDLLEERLEEALNSGRKALVFSQFTSMLAIVRARLDEKGIVYEYLDGSTRDRPERVEHFQTDEKVRVFLISLKAGGVGLNLTAADYCFILDPWWNPASEAQAIDRAHRIGQKNHVFAYRLIAKGTVEEKILDLQASKRKLVEGIIADDGDVLSDMSAKDLEFLLT